MKESEHKIEWRWGALAALAMTMLALYPQVHLIVSRGRNWTGNYAHSYRDEAAYSAYVQALINGRPRRNDPYTGREDKPGKPLPESLFSVQFLPAYVAALPGKLLGVSAPAAFIALMPIIAIASTLVLYWLLGMVTQNNRLAAAGAIIVLCLSTLVSLHGPLRMLFGLPAWTYLPFLRRYVPAIPFPFFLMLLGVVWRMTRVDRKLNLAWSGAIGAILVFLNFSYFYLWSAAIAWLACVVVLWSIARPEGWRRLVTTILLGTILSLPGVIIYLAMLAQRSRTTDAFQVLVHTRAVDLLRPSEVLSLLFLTVLVCLIAVRRLSFKDRHVLFVVSLMLLPCAVFNQQLLTGISLQPFHYEEFVTSYSVSLAGIITLSILSRRSLIPSFLKSNRMLFWTALIAFAYGANTAAGVSNGLLDDNIRRDKGLAVAERLRDLGDRDPGLILATDLWQGDMLPGVTHQPVLWALHMPVFPGNQPSEEKERFYQFLYYSGFSPARLSDLLQSGAYVLTTELFLSLYTSPSPRDKRQSRMPASA
jgi:hypothetical protein